MPSLIDLVRGATFDDFLFSPQYSVVERRDPNAIDLTSRFSTGLSVKRAKGHPAGYALGGARQPVGCPDFTTRRTR